MWAEQAIQRVTTRSLYPNVRKILDVGSGLGEHARYFRERDYEVTTVSLEPPAMHVGDFMQQEWAERYFDCLWASHVLEHQPNVQAFIKRCMAVTRPMGLIAITVPPAKHEIVGGHLTLWNQGLLLYNLVVAGLDCSRARVSPLYDGYNISVLVDNVERPEEKLRCDAGDIETLAKWFPLPVGQGFNGNFTGGVNW